MFTSGNCSLFRGSVVGDNLILVCFASFLYAEENGKCSDSGIEGGHIR